MSYNIRHAGDENMEGRNSWSNRKTMVASVIRFHNPDIAGLQKVLITQIGDMESLLPEYEWVGSGKDDGKKAGEFSPLFFKKDRFNVLSHSTFWLSETPDIVSRGWDAVCNRIVTWAQFEDLNTGRVFYVFNTHFDHMPVLAELIIN